MQKTVSLKTLVASAILCLLSGCYSTDVINSSEVRQDKIHQKYQINSNRKGEVKAEAMFRNNSQKGNSLKLSESSKITIQNQQMNGRKQLFRGFVYTKDISAETSGEYTFRFTDANSKTYENSVKVPAIGFSSIPEIIKLDDETEIPITPITLTDDDFLYLTLISNDTTSTLIYADKNDSQVSSIKIEPEDIKKIPTGSAFMVLNLSVDGKLDAQTSAGGSIKGYYTSDTVKITVVQ